MARSNISNNIIISSVVDGVDFPEANLEMISLEKDRIFSMQLKLSRLFVDQSSGIVVDIFDINFVVFENEL